MAQTIKNLPAVQDTWIRSLGGEDSLEKGMVTHSSTLPGEFHEQRSLVGYRLCGWKESDTTEWWTISLIQPHKMSWEMFLPLWFSWRDFIRNSVKSFKIFGSDLQLSSVFVQLLSSVSLCNPKNCSKPGFPVLHHWLSLFKLMSIESVMPSNHLIFYHPLLLLPSIFLSFRVFSNELALQIRWSKYCRFSIRPSNEYSGLISFRIDFFDLLVVQGTLKSLLQHHSSKASVLRHSAFFIVSSHIPIWLLEKS